MGQTRNVLRGGCNCGAVRYEITETPRTVAVCHCINCRKQSGSAFSVNLLVSFAAMTVEGELKTYVDHDTESGVPLLRQFCPKCGSPIRSIRDPMEKLIVVKAGTLDEPGAVSPTMHVWTCAALPWFEIPTSLASYERGPRP